MLKQNAYISVLENMKKIPYIKQKAVSLLAVSKKTNPESIKTLFDLGQRDFGENYVDELIEKSKLLTSEINWHFIGHLQSNKAKKLLLINNLKCIQSVDSLSLAKVIDKQCESLLRKIDIYIQVNISNEESKSGVKPNEVIQLYSEIKQSCKNINLIGIMALGTIGSKDEFEDLYCLKLKISKDLNLSLDDINISNGTSSDYELAIEFGSNQIRVGSILFDKILKETKEENKNI